jgi:hypothetical protein
MEKEKQFVYNLIILDESGSMESIKKPTISGFNEVVETTKSVEAKFPDQKHFISLVTFNGDGIKELHWNQPVDQLGKINEENYRPNCSTPLFDAIGRSVSKLREEIPADSNFSVLVTILTDGEENASVAYSSAQIKAMVEELQKNFWTFSYIGANHDVVTAARKIAIMNSMQFESDESSVKEMFVRENSARMMLAKKLHDVGRDHADFKDSFYKDVEGEDAGK